MSAPILTDFSDRISPMLVKELRQGMRAKTFVVVFLALQIFLALVLLSAGAASRSDAVGSTISGIIFTFFSIAVLIIQPLRGTNALSSEFKGNTIDMMVLTRLSAWRIVWGKWVAIVSQSALLFVAIIPYLILRYFFGGMNLVAEITTLCLVFLASMTLTAATVGLSGCTAVLIRAVVPIIGLLILCWSLLVLMLTISFGGSRGGIFNNFSLDNPESQIAVTCCVVTAIYLGWNMLSMGASLIAPAAENHAFPRRLISLALIVVICILGATGVVTDNDLQLLFAAIIALPAIFLALTESSILVRPVVLPFVKRGALGRMLGWFFYPVWSSGVLFALLITAIALAAFLMPHMLSLPGYHTWDEEMNIMIASMIGGMFFPAAVQSFFFKGEGQRISQYLLILVVSLIMCGVLAIMADAMNSSVFLWFFAWNPLAFLSMLSEAHGTADREAIFAGAVVVDLLIFMLLLVRSFMDIRRGAPVIQEVRNSLERKS